MAEPREWEEVLRKYLSWAATIAVCLFAVSGFAIVAMAAYQGALYEMARDHFAAIIGLPCAAACSLFIVLLLRTVSGSIELKVLGIEFRGAAGPIIMWILCFLAITLAIAKTWNLPYSNRTAPSTGTATRQTQ